MKVNLLDETRAFLSTEGETPNDVQYVIVGTEHFTWQQFADAAKDVNYENETFRDDEEMSRGPAGGLMIVATGWYMHRHIKTLNNEYGECVGWREQWFINYVPRKPSKKGTILTPNRLLGKE